MTLCITTDLNSKFRQAPGKDKQKDVEQQHQQVKIPLQGCFYLNNCCLLIVKWINC
jgi:hypothetical protein